MSEDTRPYRSVLYIPGSKQRALDKARSLPVDAIILDLEDAVARLRPSLQRARPWPRRWARVAMARGFRSCGSTGWRPRGGKTTSPRWPTSDPDAILLPKVNSPDEIQRLADALAPPVSVWAMLETPLGVLNAQSIAAHPRTAGFVVGSNDLAKELNCRFRADRLPLADGIANCAFGCPGRGG